MELMKSQLILGSFNTIDASEIISQMIQVKIKFHENKIDVAATEEDIKFREAKIKRLQNTLVELWRELY